MPRNLQLLLVGLAGLVLGGGLAWLLKPDSAHPANQRAPGADSAQSNHTPAGANDLAPAAPASQPSPPEQPQLPNVPDVIAPAATGIFSGTVCYPDGTPAANLAMVAFQPFLDEQNTDRIRRMTAAERVAHHSAASKWIETHTIAASTDAQGAFRISGIGDGGWLLQSTDRNIRLVRATWFTEVPFKAGDYADLLAMRVLYMTLDLKLASGEPINSANVNLKHLETGGDREFYWRPDRAECEVAAGAWKLTITGGPFGLWKAEREINVPAAGLDGPVVVELQGDNALVVTVKSPPPASQPYYSQFVLCLVAADKVPPGGPTTGTEAYRLAVNRPQPGSGREIYKDLAPGRYVVYCAVDLTFILAQMPVHYEGGGQVVEIPLPEMQAADHIVVRTFDPAGKPLGNVATTLDMDGASYPVKGVRRAPGEYWLRRAEPACLFPPGRIGTATEYRIRADHPKYGKRVATCPVGDSRVVEIRFGEAALLVVLLDNLPEDRGSLALGAFAAGDSEYLAFTTTPGPLAQRTEFRLASGLATVLLIVRRPSGQKGWWELARTNVELAPGTQEIHVAVPTLSTLRVFMPGEKGNSYAGISGEYGPGEARPVKDERVEFPQLPAGEYQLTGEAGVATVRVPYAGEFRFEAQPYNALLLPDLDNGGVMAQFGLKAGDVIRAINSTPLSGTRAELRAAFLTAASQGDVTLRIIRGGSTLVISATAGQWRSLAGYSPTATRVAE